MTFINTSFLERSGCETYSDQTTNAALFSAYEVLASIEATVELE